MNNNNNNNNNMENVLDKYVATCRAKGQPVAFVYILRRYGEVGAKYIRKTFYKK